MFTGDYPIELEWAQSPSAFERQQLLNRAAAERLIAAERERDPQDLRTVITWLAAHQPVITGQTPGEA